MATIQGGVTTSNLLEVESNKAARVVVVPRGQQYCIGESTGTIAAALAANSCVFAMRASPTGSTRAFIDAIELRWTTIVAFTTPVTAGRRLSLFRGSLAATSGGTPIATVAPKSTAFAASVFDAISGGDARIATTGALTVTGITWETTPLATITLAHVGAAGAYYEADYHFSDGDGGPIQLEPGQILGVRNPAAMDAAGTWQLGVEVHWREAAQLT